jgi:hypothetical protein
MTPFKNYDSSHIKVFKFRNITYPFNQITVSQVSAPYPDLPYLDPMRTRSHPDQ